MDAATLVSAMTVEHETLTLARAQQLIDGCNQALAIGQLNTVKRVAMFLAQIGEESGSLQYQQELGDAAYFATKDYPPYIGRTFIQITWDYNYAAFGKWCVKQHLLTDPDYFVKNPVRLADDKWAWLGPVWFWTTHNLNASADAGDVKDATQKINGGQNGFTDRQARYKHCIALGDALLGDDEAEEMALSAEAQAEVKSIVTAIVTANNAALAAAIVEQIMTAPIKRAGGGTGETSLRSTLAWLDANLGRIDADVKATPATAPSTA